MLKIAETSVTFAEFPDEVALVLSISNCPNGCKGCSSPHLRQDIGQELTTELLHNLIKNNSGITLVGFMGGDADHELIYHLTRFIHKVYGLKVGMYSGKDVIDLKLASELDYYKIGRWRMFEGPEDTWKNQTGGPIVLPTSNQVMYKRVNDELIDITDKFRAHPVKNWSSVIL